MLINLSYFITLVQRIASVTLTIQLMFHKQGIFTWFHCTNYQNFDQQGNMIIYSFIFNIVDISII